MHQVRIAGQEFAICLFRMLQPTGPVMLIRNFERLSRGWHDELFAGIRAGFRNLMVA